MTERYTRKVCVKDVRRRRCGVTPGGCRVLGSIGRGEEGRGGWEEQGEETRRNVSRELLGG